MHKIILVVMSSVAIFMYSGCGIRAIHPQTFDRVDQDLSVGNRGYLKGTPPKAADRSGLKRELMAIDIDLGLEEEETARPESEKAKSKGAAPSRTEDTSNIK